MKTYRTILFILAFLLPLVTIAQTEKRKLKEFDRISVFGNMDVDLIKSDSFNVKISAQGANLEEITSIVDGMELKIRMVSDLFSDAQVTVRVYYKELREISATGGACIHSDMLIKIDNLELKAGSGGEIYLWNVDINSLEAKVTKGSVILVSGKAKTQIISASAGGTYSAFDLESENAFVETNTGGKAKVRVSKKLDAKAISKGYIGYQGEPETIDKKESLGGEVKEDTGEEEE